MRTTVLHDADRMRAFAVAMDKADDAPSNSSRSAARTE